MDNFDKFTELINYIEANLDADIEPKKMAQILCVNEYTMYRIFTFLTGMTLTEYIRKRRLSMVAIELQNSDIKIIDLAIPPLVVPFSTTLAPIIGSSEASKTTPVTAIVCSCSFISGTLPETVWVAITLSLPNSSALIATAVRNLLYANPRFLRSSFIND